MKTLRLFLVAALAAAFLSPSSEPAEAQTSVLLPPVRTTELYIQRRAISKIGSAIGSAVNVAWYFDDFFGNVNNVGLANGWAFTPTGSGNLSLQLNDEGGGVQQTTSGSTAASRGSNQTVSPAIRAAGTVAWYVAHRTKITAAVTAQTKAYSGLLNAAATGTIVSGILGNLSAANFVVQYDGNEAGSFVSLAVAVDTNYHVFEVWCLGDVKLHCDIDFGADLCAGVAMASAPTDALNGIRVVANGTDAVTRNMRDDWFAIMAKRN